MKLNIIDVSSWNPSINWAKVAQAVDGVIIRAGYRGTRGGLTTDSLFLSHIRGAITAGVRRIGIYWWTTHNTVQQAQADSVYLIKLLEPYRDKITFGVWLDSEAPGANNPGTSGKAFLALSASVRTTCHLAFLSALRAAGYTAGVYASDSWFVERLSLSRLAGYPLWVASYSYAPKAVRINAGWQFTDRATVSGISNGVDKSYFYTDLAAGQLPQKPTHDLRTLRKGDVGQQVRALQKLLGGIAVDGDFGPETRGAVEAYQRQYKLEVDGIVGPRTWSALLGSAG